MRRRMSSVLSAPRWTRSPGTFRSRGPRQATLSVFSSQGRTSGAPALWASSATLHPRRSGSGKASVFWRAEEGVLRTRFSTRWTLPAQLDRLPFQRLVVGGALRDLDEPVHGEILESLANPGGGPPDLELFDSLGGSHADLLLEAVAPEASAAATDGVDLTGLPVLVDDQLASRSDAGAVRFDTHQFDGQPVVGGSEVIEERACGQVDWLDSG